MVYLEESVHVFSRPLTLSLTAEDGNVQQSAGSSRVRPAQQRASPSPAQSTKSSSHGDDYARMMASIPDRTQQRRSEMQQDETRRVESLLKYMAKVGGVQRGEWG